MASVSNEIEQLIARLAPETRRQRQSALLRPLNFTFLGITLLGLIVVLLESPDPINLAFLSVSLLVNVVVGVLDWKGFPSAASYLFSSWVNIGILILVAVNLLVSQDLAVGSLFASQLALSVMLAGMLLGIPYALAFVLVNVVVLMAALYAYKTMTGIEGGIDRLQHVSSVGVPVAAFLVLIVVITWLYQRALAKAEEQVEAARRQIIQDELLRRDLALARELQLRLFPPPPLTSESLRIASRSQPARETSGDFYDFVDLDDSMLGIVVADVTGKSVSAALMMALARVTLRSEARRHAAPAAVLRSANETICRDHTARQLITAFYGRLDTRTLELRFANAGHPYPILRRGSRLLEIELAGMPLGGRPDASYAEHVVQLEPGDQLYLISDGLVEERNARREMFGYGRLGPAILATDPCDPDRALNDVWQAVASFRGASEQADDITLLVLQALPLASVTMMSAPLAHRAAQP